MDFLTTAVSALGTMIAAGYVYWRWYEHKYIGHINSGAQRRALFPFSKGLTESAQAVLDADDIEVERKMHTLKSGEQLFCQVLKAKNVAPSYVLVLCHGAFSASDIYMECAATFVRRGAIVVLPDLPAHGRSDGLLGYVPDLFAWVDQIWELLDIVVPPLRKLGSKNLKVFCSGNSLGGGLATCLGLQRPQFFDGLVIIAPCLGVSDDVKPPEIVLQLFKNVLGPFKLRAPCTPSKDLGAFDFRVPEQGHLYTKASPVSMQGLKARLATAKEIAFTFSDWVQERMEDMRVPFLIVHGTEDKICEGSQSQHLYDRASSKDKQIKFYEGGYHCELVCCLPGNEANIRPHKWLPEQSEMTKTCLNDIAEWLAARA